MANATPSKTASKTSKTLDKLKAAQPAGRRTWLSGLTKAQRAELEEIRRCVLAGQIRVPTREIAATLEADMGITVSVHGLLRFFRGEMKNNGH